MDSDKLQVICSAIKLSKSVKSVTSTFADYLKINSMWSQNEFINGPG